MCFLSEKGKHGVEIIASSNFGVASPEKENRSHPFSLNQIGLISGACSQV
jgi:hypothetical protein